MFVVRHTPTRSEKPQQQQLIYWQYMRRDESGELADQRYF